jgi:hypothetical protein
MTAVPAFKTAFRANSPHWPVRTAEPPRGAPLSAAQVRARLYAGLCRTSPPFFRVGQIDLLDARFARAELLTPTGYVVLHMQVDRLTGRIVRYD